MLKPHTIALTYDIDEFELAVKKQIEQDLGVSIPVYVDFDDGTDALMVSFGSELTDEQLEAMEGTPYHPDEWFQNAVAVVEKLFNEHAGAYGWYSDESREYEGVEVYFPYEEYEKWRDSVGKGEATT